MIDLEDEATSRFLHSGNALLIGTIGTEGMPRACRAWGLKVTDPDAGVVRVLVENDDPITMRNIRDDGRIAVTATSVSTHQSIQLKGRITSIEDPTPDDEALREHYTGLLLFDITSIHGYAPEMLRKWARQHVVACVVEIDASFDQTPGPSAGSVIDKDRR